MAKRFNNHIITHAEGENDMDITRRAVFDMIINCPVLKKICTDEYDKYLDFTLQKPTKENADFFVWGFVSGFAACAVETKAGRLNMLMIEDDNG